MRFTNRVKWLAVASVFLASGNLAAQSTATVRGRITETSRAPVVGVQVVIGNQTTGAQYGAISGADGTYVVAGLRAGGPYRIEVKMIGYGLEAEDDITLVAGETRTIDFEIGREAVALDALEVFATRAVERQTPVAFSNVQKTQIQNQLGSQDLPMVMNSTPAVYATMQGGGAGDARINVRGFDQRNIAVMINGVPVNDMENGWVYWSNWDGLGDAATSIQLQRGLSAVNLATPSIGGTLNIITDPTARQAGLSYKQEFGNASFLKETFVFDTGLLDNRFAFTGSVVRKTGDGLWKSKSATSPVGNYNDGRATYTDAWAYYFAAAFQINPRNRLEFYAAGAPQKHGQNLYKLNLATMDADFARDLGYTSEALAAFPEAGRFWSPNVNTVSSYGEEQYASSGPGAGTFERHGSNYLNERENFFHKPQVNLNYYADLGNGLSWTTVGYYSGGNGGGSGTLGSLVWDYTYGQRFADWDATIARNRANATGSRGILRASVNNQWTIGAISKLRKSFSEGLTGEVGLDWRTAEVNHYRDVRDLLGGDYWLDSDNELTGPRQTTYGDKIDYYNTNTVDWIGGYLQLEKSDANGSVYAMVGGAQNAYNFTDHFKEGADGNELKLESGNMRGYQFKAGVTRNLTDEWYAFGNAGYISKVPNFDGAIDDVTGVVNLDPKNETTSSFEVGLKYSSADRRLTGGLNLYHTTWNDRTLNIYVPQAGPNNEDIIANVLGVNERHVGVELQGGYQPSNLLRFDVSASLGDWHYLDDAEGRLVSGDRQTSEEYAFYIRDLKVSDQPQTQFVYSASLFPLEGSFLQVLGRTNYNYYAFFDPFGRTNSDDRAQSWKTPGYTVFDFHGAYRIGDLIPAWTGGDVRLFAHVFNIFDNVYIQDATDNSSFNGFYGGCTRTNRPCAANRGHNAMSAEVYLGLPRMFNVGFEVSF